MIYRSKNHGKTIGKWWFFMEFDGIYPEMVITNSFLAGNWPYK